MSEFLSPSVQIQESNKSFYIKQGAEFAMFIGHFEKGPVNIPQFITDINHFKFVFGRGINEHCNDWYQVYNYLQYSSGIWVCRSAGQKKVNSSNEEPIFINDNYNYNDIKETIKTENIKFIARTPGRWGDLLSISIITLDEYNNNVNLNSKYKAKSVFTFFEENYYGVCVFRNNVLKETYYITKDEFDTINESSQYIYVESTNPYAAYDDNIIKLSGGMVVLASDEDILESYELFENKEIYDIDIIIGNQLWNELAINLAEIRKDCIAFIGIPTQFETYLKILVNSKYTMLYSPAGYPTILNILKLSSDDYLNKIEDYINKLPRSEFVHFTFNVKEQYDGFSQKNKIINIAGDTAGLKGQASLQNFWTPSAGLTNGIIKNYTKIFLLLGTKDIAKYYQRGLNYIQNGRLQTQKTFYTEKSHFNRTYVRSVFNHIEKEVQKQIRYFVFNENTVQERSKIALELKRYFTDLKASGAITNAKIYVKPLEKDQIQINIWVQPKSVIEFINIRMSNVGTNVFTDYIIGA